MGNVTLEKETGGAAGVDVDVVVDGAGTDPTTEEDAGSGGVAAADSRVVGRSGGAALTDLSEPDCATISTMTPRRESPTMPPMIHF